jgi:hypothetical protein
MRETYGADQGDAWLHARIGRLTGSRLAEVCSYLERKSGDKVAGDSSGTRDRYMLEIISERLTGRDKDQFNSPAMQRGAALEEDARMCYEKALNVIAEPVGFVVHPLYDFTGATADSLVNDEGVLEIKCLLPWNHLKYVLAEEVPEEYIPQVAWEMACTGRKWADFVLYCPDIIGAEELRFWYRRIHIEDLRWTVTDYTVRPSKDTVLEGQAVIDYFTNEVLKFEAEIQAFMAKHHARPVAPYPLQLKGEK